MVKIIKGPVWFNDSDPECFIFGIGKVEWKLSNDILKMEEKRNAQYFKDLTIQNAGILEQQLQREYTELLNWIENQIKNSKEVITSVTWYDSIGSRLTSKLEENGFKIESYSARNETYTTISW